MSVLQYTSCQIFIYWQCVLKNFLQVDYVIKKFGNYKFIHSSYEGLFIAENSRGQPSLILCSVAFLPIDVVFDLSRGHMDRLWGMRD